MKTLLLALALAPALASAQVQASASFSIDLPVVLPQLVIVQPGIRVVPGLEVEVFQVDGYFWTQRDGRWYRSKSHRGGWAYMNRGVPPGLRSMPPGRYRHYRPAPPPPRRVEDRGGHDRRDDRGRNQDGDRGHDRGHDRDRDDGRDGGKGHGKRD